MGILILTHLETEEMLMLLNGLGCDGARPSNPKTSPTYPLVSCSLR